MRILDKRYPRLSDAAVAVVGHKMSVVVVTAMATCRILFGFLDGFPNEWFLIANIIGTLVTVLMLLLVQHSRNRDMRALQVKVDELLRSSDTAANHLIAAEQREAHEFAALLEAR